MAKLKVYVSPSAKRGAGYGNPYLYNMKDCLASHFHVLERDSKPCLAQGTALLSNSLKADVFVLNFLESIGFQKLSLLQYLMARMSLWIMRLRKRKVVYMFHNMRPHQGENFMTKGMTRLMLRQSSAVVSHSKAAAEHAKERLREMGLPDTKVRYVCHPVKKIKVDRSKSFGESCDVFIWGAVLPYKGILEFVRDPRLAESGLSVRIIGSCKDEALAKALKERETGKVKFENRKASFDEIAWHCAKARFTLFPYLPGSVSSSGALIDTIVFGGRPLGPDIGAFSDLHDEGVCSVYDNREEMFRILGGGTMPLPEEAREDFISRNSWGKFGDTLAEIIG